MKLDRKADLADFYSNIQDNICGQMEFLGKMLDIIES